MVVRRVGIASLAKMLGAIYAVIGLIAGSGFALIGMFGGAVAAMQQGGELGALGGLLFGFGGIIVMPLLYGLVGALFGALSALLYNLFAGVVGGIVLETDPPAATAQTAAARA